MNLDAQIKDCSACKAKFTSAMDQGAETSLLDDICEFGTWLNGDAKKQYGHFSIYETCVQMNSKCHLLAGKVASAVDNKKYMDAQAMLGSGAPLGVLSTSMAVAIMQLKREAKEWD
ncbi:hypothetical protein [Undibacterium sp. Ren11W]|uniref:hypothetical protein n=1 Tax=Undibacterium sp. Ren11W TaxID=3413045 RepID=UPI003BF132D7